MAQQSESTKPPLAPGKSPSKYSHYVPRVVGLQIRKGHFVSRSHSHASDSEENTPETPVSARARGLSASMIQLLSPAHSSPVLKLTGCVVVCDISGFTKATELLTNRVDGVELISETLNTSLVTIMERLSHFGGDTLYFAGDFVVCAWFAQEEDTGNDYRSRPEFLSLLSILNVVGLKNEVVVQGSVVSELKVHMSLTSGDFNAHSLGWRQSRHIAFEGSTLTNAHQLLQMANNGECAMSNEIFESLKKIQMKSNAVDNFLDFDEFQVKPLPRWMTVDEVDSIIWIVTPQSGDEAFGPAEYSIDISADDIRKYESALEMDSEDSTPRNDILFSQFVPTNLLLSANGSQGSLNDDVAETAPQVPLSRPDEQASGQLRHVTVIFVMIDCDQGIETTVRQVIARCQKHKGQFVKCWTSERGYVCLCVFGTPGFTSNDDAARAVTFVMALKDEVHSSSARLNFGIASGRAYCGTMGSSIRKEYSVIGSPVNLAASLGKYVVCDLGVEGTCVAACCSSTKALCSEHPIFWSEPQQAEIRGFEKPVTYYEPNGTAIGHRGSFRGRPASFSSRRSSKASYRSGSLSRIHSKKSFTVETVGEVVEWGKDVSGMPRGVGPAGRASPKASNRHNIVGRDIELRELNDFLTKVKRRARSRGGSAKGGMRIGKPYSSSWEPNEEELYNTLILTGDAGMGKSLLLQYSADLCEHLELDYVLLMGDPLQSSTPYSGLRSILYEMAETAVLDVPLLTEDIPESELKIALPLIQQLIQTTNKASSLSTLLYHLSLRVPESKPNEQQNYKPTQQVEIVNKFLIKLFIEICNLDNGCPFVIIIDDIYNIDNVSLKFFLKLMDQCPTIVCLGSRRLPEEGGMSSLASQTQYDSFTKSTSIALGVSHEMNRNEEEWLQLLGRQPFRKLRILSHDPDLRELKLREMEISPLRKPAINNLLCHLMQVTTADYVLVDLLHDWSGGNPGIAEQLIMQLKEQGKLQTKKNNKVVLLDGSACDLQDTKTQQELNLPTAIETLLISRLDQLPPDLITVLRTASVIGRPFDVELIAELCNKDVTDMTAILQDCCNRQLLTETKTSRWKRTDDHSKGEGRFDTHSYSFKLGISSSVIYNNMLFKQRKELHAICGRILEKRGTEAPIIAYHFSRSDDSQKALHFITLAAQNSFDSQQYSECMEWVKQALGIEQSGSRSKWLLMLSICMYQTCNAQYFDNLVEYFNNEFIAIPENQTNFKRKILRLKHQMRYTFGKLSSPVERSDLVFQEDTFKKPTSVKLMAMNLLCIHYFEIQDSEALQVMSEEYLNVATTLQSKQHFERASVWFAFSKFFFSRLSGKWFQRVVRIGNDVLQVQNKTDLMLETLTQLLSIYMVKRDQNSLDAGGHIIQFLLTYKTSSKTREKGFQSMSKLRKPPSIQKIHLFSFGLLYTALEGRHTAAEEFLEELFDLLQHSTAPDTLALSIGCSVFFLSVLQGETEGTQRIMLSRLVRLTVRDLPLSISGFIGSLTSWCSEMDGDSVGLVNSYSRLKTDDYGPTTTILQILAVYMKGEFWGDFSCSTRSSTALNFVQTAAMTLKKQSKSLRISKVLYLQLMARYHLLEDNQTQAYKYLKQCCEASQELRLPHFEAQSQHTMSKLDTRVIGTSERVLYERNALEIYERLGAKGREPKRVKQ